MKSLTGYEFEAVLDKLLILLERSTLQDAVTAIALIVEERMSLPRHMHTNLVCTASFQTALHQRDIVVAAQHLEVCHCVLTLLAIGEYIHLHSILGVTTDMTDDSTLILSEITPHQSHIAAIDGVVEELLCQVGVSLLVLGYDQQTRGILVDTVHKTCAGITLAEHLEVLEVVRQCVHQSAAMVTHTRVHNHTGSLINHDNVIILIDDIQRYVLWHNLLLTTRIWHHDRYLVERLNLVTRLLRFAVYEDVTTIGSGLNAVSRGVLEAYGEELVETHLRLSLIHRNGEVLIHLITLAITLLHIYVHIGE